MCSIAWWRYGYAWSYYRKYCGSILWNAAIYGSHGNKNELASEKIYGIVFVEEV